MKIIADCNNIGVRIDKIISGLCPSIPRTKIQEAIESGKFERRRGCWKVEKKQYHFYNK